MASSIIRRKIISHLLMIVLLSAIVNYCRSSSSVSPTGAQIISSGLQYIHDSINDYNQDPDEIYSEISSCQLKAYRPTLFKLLRQQAGISEVSYKEALNPNCLLEIYSDSKSGIFIIGIN